MSSASDEIDLQARTQAIRNLHRLLLLYPGGIEMDILKRLYHQKYPELIDVDTVLGTVEGRLVKTRIFEEPQQLRICYPMPLEGFSTAKIYARYFEDLADHKQGLAYHVKLADVSSAGSFAVYLPRHGRDLEELNRGMMNFYARGRTEGAECIEQGSHYAYEDVDDVRIIRRYKRVRVNYISEPKDFEGLEIGEETSVHCTRIDFGGDVDLRPEYLLQLPARMNPDTVLFGDLHVGLQFLHYPYAVKCIIPFDPKVGPYPQSRRQLHYALTLDRSGEKDLKSLPLVQVHFVRYDEERCAFVAYPVNSKGRSLLAERQLHFDNNENGMEH